MVIKFGQHYVDQSCYLARWSNQSWWRTWCQLRPRCCQCHTDHALGWLPDGTAHKAVSKHAFSLPWIVNKIWIRGKHGVTQMAVFRRHLCASVKRISLNGRLDFKPALLSLFRIVDLQSRIPMAALTSSISSGSETNLFLNAMFRIDRSCPALVFLCLLRPSLNLTPLLITCHNSHVEIYPCVCKLHSAVVQLLTCLLCAISHFQPNTLLPSFTRRMNYVVVAFHCKCN